VNTEGEGSGIGVGSGEVKAAEPIVAVEGIPGGLKGRGHAVESRDKTSHTETLRVNEEARNITTPCAQVPEPRKGCPR
jgi:hypothetical protein